MSATKAKRAAKKIAPASNSTVKGNITLAEAQKLLKAKAKTLASVPGRSKVLVVKGSGSLAVVQKVKGKFKVALGTTDLKEAVAAYNKLK